VLCVVYCRDAYGAAYGKETLFLGCGDVADISNNNGTTAAETDCNMPCSGDSSHLCGGSWRLQLYIWNGALNNWQMPSNIGRYEVRAKVSFLYMLTRATCYLVHHQRPHTCYSCHCRYKRQDIFPREIRQFLDKILYWRIRTRPESPK